VHLFEVDLPGLEVRRHLLDEREVRQEDAYTPPPRELVSVDTPTTRARVRAAYPERG
jgi:hypothetical protein